MKQPHILCEAKDIAPYVILPGDPARVLRVGEMLDSYEEVAYNREFRTIRGLYKGVPITVTSTGIGGPATAIAIEELVTLGGRYFIRIGSSGAMQTHIRLGDLVIATGAVREDGTTKTYVNGDFPAVADIRLTSKIIKVCQDLKYPYHYGVVRSHDSLYSDDSQEVRRYWNEKRVLASDMETSTLLTLAQLKGVRAASILNTVVEYEADLKEGIGEYVGEESILLEGERREIHLALESLYSIHQEDENKK